MRKEAFKNPPRPVTVRGRGGEAMFGGGDSEALARMCMMAAPLLHHASSSPGISGEMSPSSATMSRVREERVGQAQPHWSHDETREFIAVRAELEMDFNVSKRTKTLWEVVSAKMREKGYRRSPEQCKCKWKNLVNRYKGKETSDPEIGKQCPFFEELHAVFTLRAQKMQQSLLQSETHVGQAKNESKRVAVNRCSGEISEAEIEFDEDSEEERSTRSNSRKRKADRNIPDKSSRSSIAISTSDIQEMLNEFLQQQQRIEMQWREIMNRRSQERQLFEQEWRQSMEKLEREKLMMEQAWREREEQRRIREENKAERRDALLTTLLNRLIRESS